MELQTNQDFPPSYIDFVRSYLHVRFDFCYYGKQILGHSQLGSVSATIQPCTNVIWFWLTPHITVYSKGKNNMKQ